MELTEDMKAELRRLAKDNPGYSGAVIFKSDSELGWSTVIRPLMASAYDTRYNLTETKDSYRTWTVDDIIVANLYNYYHD